MTAPGVTVRPARDDELDAAGALVAEAYRVMPGMDGDDEYLEFVRDARARVGKSEVLVAVDPAGRVLGSVSYVPGVESELAEAERPGEAGFRMLGVVAEARGHGVGRALVQGCIERARAADRTALAIVTMPDWRDAERLYRGMGFRRATERDVVGDGYRLLAYVLEL